MASEIRFRELALEEKRIEAEQERRRELRKMELELKMIEEKRLEREAEQMRLKREAEAEQMNVMHQMTMSFPGTGIHRRYDCLMSY